MPVSTKKRSQLFSELKVIEAKESALNSGINNVKEEENTVLQKLNRYLNKEERMSKKAYFEVMHFTFNDFAQAIIGASIFSFAPFLDTDPWNYLKSIDTTFLFGLPLFFIFCVFIALNYEFRDNFKPNFWFMRLLVKRLFYIYFSVMMVMCLVLIMINRINYDSTLLDATRNILAIQTVGLMGAVTFSFLKK